MLHHILNISDLTKSDLDYILSVAGNIANNPSRYGEVAKGKILATLFFEPSTRTRLSFESAMLRLGGGVIGFSDMSASSAAKGESIEDTSRVVSCYCDVMAVRHPVAFEPHKMASVATVPVINAGDGANEHPTQTLTDLVTIRQRFGRLDNLCIGLCGDLKYGRTVHSLIKMMARYPGNRFVLVAPESLQMPADIIALLDEGGIEYTVTDDLEAAIPDLDVLYMTRIQRERFEDKSAYERLRGIYILDAAKLGAAKKDMVVLHPLPRVDEIATDVDSDERAWYFKQAQFGVYARMALMIALLGLNNMMGEDMLYVSAPEKRDADRLQAGA
ncbi:MAG: aspartate carbamoyltransferase [Oscillospiraceae bacterium]|jgi:aspartate carbamoyltransferase catalytic subunit|nr:aspartate carbamoyltransferase [Oscillospiraceae bacterium]